MTIAKEVKKVSMPVNKVPTATKKGKTSATPKPTSPVNKAKTPAAKVSTKTTKGASKTNSSLVKESASLGLGFVPFLGDAKDLQEAASGVDLITGRKLKTSDRIISAVCVVLPVVSGKAVRVAKEAGGKIVSKAISYAPVVAAKAKLAAKAVANTAKKAASKAAEKAKSTLNGVIGFLGSGLKKVTGTKKGHISLGSPGKGATEAGYKSGAKVENLLRADKATKNTINVTEWRRTIDVDDIQAQRIKFLGEDSVKVGTGKWRSLDGERQFRTTPNDYLGKHGIGKPTVPNTPHVHFEFLQPKGNKFVVTKNVHVPIKK